MLDANNSKFVAFKVGQYDITVISENNEQYIVAKGADTLTHVIEDRELILRLIEKYTKDN